MFRQMKIEKAAAELPTGMFTGVEFIEFLARLAALRGVRRYLEVGVHFGTTLAEVPCEVAVGVDPAFILDKNVMRGKRQVSLFQETSDRFFADRDVKAIMGGPVELAFLDGLHQFEFLLRDFRNAEAVADRNGLIALHDCMPFSAEMTDRDGSKVRTDAYPTVWTGDVWKIVPILRRFRPDLDVTLVDCAPVGIVCVGNLDPGSAVLTDRYLEIVRAWRDVPNDLATIGRMYADNPVVSSQAILTGQDHGLFLRA